MKIMLLILEGSLSGNLFSKLLVNGLEIGQVENFKVLGDGLITILQGNIMCEYY